jgi:transcriptional repressor NrdR
MKCPFCNYPESKVLDTRAVPENNSIKRRRECLECQKRFTTFEMLETVQIIFVKKSGNKELYDRAKLLGGVLKATQKRPVSADEIVSEIEAEIHNSLDNEVSSAQLGEMVMQKLKERDHVSYVRFASVYREFTDVDSFVSELLNLKKSEEEKEN